MVHACFVVGLTEFSGFLGLLHAGLQGDERPWTSNLFLTLFQKSGVEEDYSDTLSEAAGDREASGRV